VKLGYLTDRQYLVLEGRGKGLTQAELASQMKTSRANVSMIELRARRKVERARETLEAFERTLTIHQVIVEPGTWIYDVPSKVLGAGDRTGIHLRSNLVEIIRMVKASKPACLARGKTKRRLVFAFNQKGKVTLNSEGT
jgi:Tfx family DNA-binding protein